jgi:hypothetical protein
MANFKNLRRNKTLGAPPPLEEASPNLSAPETAPAPAPPPPTSEALPKPKPTVRKLPVAEPTEELVPDPIRGQGRTHRDGRSLRRTGRTLQFATRVSPDFDARLRTIAENQGMLIVEVLEQALDAYEAKLR